MKAVFPLVTVLAAASVAVVPALAQDHAHHHGAPQDLGRVSFETSCDDAAQPHFERGVAALHSFYFSAAIGAFEQALEADRECAMAHWGIALARMDNPFIGQDPPAGALEAGRAAAERAAAIGASTEREAGYIAAVQELYRDVEGRSHRERMQAYERAMDEVRHAHHGDREAAIFYALSVVANAPPDDLTFEAQQRAGEEILFPLFDEHPDHPGLAHYIIHAYDFPPLADRGLEAALRYAEIAPDAPHALHMPSHIFTRLGYWEESVETNRRSYEAEEGLAMKTHPLDYLVYAHLQLGQDREALRALKESREVLPQAPEGVLGYNWVAMEARYALELDRWEDAARLYVPDGVAPYVRAISHFARGLGAARTGDSAGARAEAAALEEIRGSLEAAGEREWATRVEAQQLAVSAWGAHSEGRHDEALRLARSAAEVEERVEKHPVTPGPLLPARELEGDLLLELDRRREAHEAYERVLDYEPRRARAIYGAARSAEMAGLTEAARERYQELLTLMAGSDGTRRELEAASAFLERR